jgi:hypothetical protein
VLEASLMALTPKDCIVRFIVLDGAGRAEVRLGCSKGFEPQQYRSQHVRARTVRFRGVHVTGKARLDFVLSPASAVCKKSGAEIACKLAGETSSESLRGARRRRMR